jgi:hypothetical protein
MIYFTAASASDIFNFTSGIGLPKSSVRAITESHRLTGLTGGNLYVLPSYERNYDKDIIPHALERRMQVIFISNETTLEQILIMEEGK